MVTPIQTDLRRLPPQPAAPAGLPANIPLPLPPGTIIQGQPRQLGERILFNAPGGDYPVVPEEYQLLPEEAATLKKCGWAPGMAIPADMAERILAAQEAAASGRLAASGRQPLQARELDIDQLPPEQRQALIDSVRSATETLRQMRQANAAMIPGAGPGVNESIAAARTVNITSDAYRRPPAAATPPVSVAPAPQMAPAQSPAMEGAGGSPTGTVCQRCGWQGGADPVEVTDDDKLNYLIAMSGGQRFRKQYRLFGGRVAVGFRDLTSLEGDAAYRQVVLDAQEEIKEKRSGTTLDYWRSLFGYRLVMGLEFVATQGTGRISVPELGDFTVDQETCPPPHTPLYAVYPKVIAAALSSESLRKAVGAAHRAFEDLMAKLEACARDENFWKGIDGRG